MSKKGLLRLKKFKINNRSEIEIYLNGAFYSNSFLIFSVADSSSRRGKEDIGIRFNKNIFCYLTLKMEQSYG